MTGQQSNVAIRFLRKSILIKAVYGAVHPQSNSHMQNFVLVSIGKFAPFVYNQFK